MDGRLFGNLVSMWQIRCLSFHGEWLVPCFVETSTNTVAAVRNNSFHDDDSGQEWDTIVVTTTTAIDNRHRHPTFFFFFFSYPTTGGLAGHGKRRLSAIATSPWSVYASRLRGGIVNERRDQESGYNIVCTMELSYISYLLITYYVDSYVYK